MKVAIFGRGLASLPQAILAEIVDTVRFSEELWSIIPDLFHDFREFVEPTLYVGSYQSRNERPIIWAAALKQFRRR